MIDRPTFNDGSLILPPLKIDHRRWDDCDRPTFDLHAVISEKMGGAGSIIPPLTAR
jgi:hypothetical protein